MKVVDGMPADIEYGKDGMDGKRRLQKPLVTVLNKEPVQRGLGELEPFEENGVSEVSVSLKDDTPVSEKQVTTSSIANGC